MTEIFITEPNSIWKPIKGFDDFECTIDGKVRNIKTNNILKLQYKNRCKFYNLYKKSVSLNTCLKLSFIEFSIESNCLSCGGKFYVIGNNINYCSKQCCPKSKVDFARARKKKFNDFRGIKPRKPAKIRFCKSCGKENHQPKISIFCSDQCKPPKKIREVIVRNCLDCNVCISSGKRCSPCSKKKAKEYRRLHRQARRRMGLEPSGKSYSRAKHYGVKYKNVKPLEVFNKTNGKCHICKKKLKWEDRGKIMDMAPEVDHLWPISKGGHHLFENLMIACRKCNALKKDYLL